jgi:hypothetical protein
MTDGAAVLENAILARSNCRWQLFSSGGDAEPGAETGLLN